MLPKLLFKSLFNLVLKFWILGEIQANVFLHVGTKQDVTKEMQTTGSYSVKTDWFKWSFYQLKSSEDSTKIIFYICFVENKLRKLMADTKKNKNHC